MTTAIEEARSKTNNGSHDAVSSKRRILSIICILSLVLRRRVFKRYYREFIVGIVYETVTSSMIFLL